MPKLTVWTGLTPPPELVSVERVILHYLTPREALCFRPARRRSAAGGAKTELGRREART